MQEEKNIIRCALKDSLPVLSGYLVVGMTFGILLDKAGYGVLWALLASFTIYSGAMQFVLVTLITSGAPLITVALTTLTVNARYMFYGISLIERYQRMGRIRYYLIFALTDETYSLLCDKDDSTPKSYYIALSLFNQCYWVAGALIGSILGSIIPFDIAGIEFAMTALFIVVVVEQWLSSKDHTPAIIGFIASIGSLLLFGSEEFLIPTMLIILATLSLRYKRESRENKEQKECYD